MNVKMDHVHDTTRFVLGLCGFVVACCMLAQAFDDRDVSYKAVRCRTAWRIRRPLLDAKSGLQGQAAVEMSRLLLVSSFSAWKTGFDSEDSHKHHCPALGG